MKALLCFVNPQKYSIDYQKIFFHLQFIIKYSIICNNKKFISYLATVIDHPLTLLLRKEYLCLH